MLEYYGATSEVPWLFLLANWVVGLIVAACLYTVWNWRGLRARIGILGAEPGLTGLIGATELSAASGLVPKSGWNQSRLIGPLNRGPVGARSWVL